uniref:Uncharacterized protein n=1 Tax=Arion vulgaris TaxID=1028688 RepID=A0A0B6ZGD7_9EUPU
MTQIMEEEPYENEIKYWINLKENQCRTVSSPTDRKLWTSMTTYSNSMVH